MSLATEYEGLFRVYRKVERQMLEEPGVDGQQRELQSSARRIITFEHQNGLPALRELITAHGEAVSKIESAQGKLEKLRRAIRSQEAYLTIEFPTSDTIDEVLNLIAWRENALWGAKAVEQLTSQAAEIESELKAFVRSHPGVTDCLPVPGQWDRLERENFAWMNREFENRPADQQEAA